MILQLDLLIILGRADEMKLIPNKNDLNDPNQYELQVNVVLNLLNLDELNELTKDDMFETSNLN